MNTVNAGIKECFLGDGAFSERSLQENLSKDSNSPVMGLGTRQSGNFTIVNVDEFTDNKGRKYPNKMSFKSEIGTMQIIDYQLLKRVFATKPKQNCMEVAILTSGLKKIVNDRVSSGNTDSPSATIMTSDTGGIFRFDNPENSGYLWGMTLFADMANSPTLPIFVEGTPYNIAFSGTWQNRNLRAGDVIYVDDVMYKQNFTVEGNQSGNPPYEGFSTDDNGKSYVILPKGYYVVVAPWMPTTLEGGGYPTVNVGTAIQLIDARTGLLVRGSYGHGPGDTPTPNSYYDPVNSVCHFHTNKSILAHTDYMAARAVSNTYMVFPIAQDVLPNNGIMTAADSRMGFEVDFSFGLKDRYLKFNFERQMPYLQGIAQIIGSQYTRMGFASNSIPALDSKKVSSFFDMPDFIPNNLEVYFQEMNIVDFTGSIKSKTQKNTWGVSMYSGFTVELKATASSLDVGGLIEAMRYVMHEDIVLSLPSVTGTRVKLVFCKDGLTQLGNIEVNDDKREATITLGGTFDVDLVASSDAENTIYFNVYVS